jgi:predicted nucleic acid-binding Zn ribbon protein
MSERRKRRRNPYFLHIGDVLEKVLKKQQLSLPKKDVQIMTAWGKAVGPIIAAQTAMERFTHGTLYIKVSNSVWMQQLQFMKEEITVRINDVIGAQRIRNILFSIGAIKVAASDNAKPAAETAQTVALTQKEIRTIDSCTATLKDPELGEIVRRAMTKGLQRKKI